MPVLGRDTTIFLVLVCCAPLQYWLAQHTYTSPEQRTAKVYQLVGQVRQVADRWLSTAAWRDWLLGLRRRYLKTDYSQWYGSSGGDEGQCPAVEVWHLRSPDGSFAMSPVPRKHRPLVLRLRVGQVVKHKRWGYKGVVIGWDLSCKAPEDWIEKMHNGHKHWREQPNYAILVDTADREEPQVTYVPQENLAPLLKTEVDHPELANYFDYYDGAQYIPSPWLQAVYPLD